jgi:hypothetical protein
MQPSSLQPTRVCKVSRQRLKRTWNTALSVDVAGSIVSASSFALTCGWLCASAFSHYQHAAFSSMLSEERMACLQELGVPDYRYYLKLNVCLGVSQLELHPDCDS